MSSAVRVPIELAEQQAKAAAKALREELDKTADAAEGVESAGKTMARALGQAADDLVADFERADAAADALTSALGPEMAAKLGQNGVDDLVADLKRLGLTYDDIEADAEELAAAVKRLDDVGSQNVRQVDNRMRELGETTDNTRSVTANFVGNTVSELPGIAGAMGPVNQALGQFGEYAAEGNIKMASFVQAGIGMAAVGFVASKVAGHFASIAATKAFRREQVAEFADELREAAKAGEDLSGTLDEMARNDGKIEFRFLDKTIDAVPLLDRLGVSSAEFFAAVEGGQPALDAFQARLEAAGKGGDTLGLVMVAGRQKAEDYAKATTDVEQELRVFGKTQEDVEGTTDDLSKAQDTAADRLETVAQRAEDARAAQEELRRELQDAVGTTHDYDRALLELDGTYAALQEQIMANAATQADGEVSDREKAASARELKLAEYDLAAQVLDSAGKFAQQQGAVDGSKEAVRLQIEELERSKSKYPELVPYIDDYIRALGRIPTSITTRITPVTGQVVRYAEGTQYHPGGPAIVGEEGPEAVDLPMGTRVHTADRTAEMMGPSSGSGSGQTVINYWPAGVDPVSVLNAQRLYARRNGPT